MSRIAMFRGLDATLRSLQEESPWRNALLSLGTGSGVPEAQNEGFLVDMAPAYKREHNRKSMSPIALIRA